MKFALSSISESAVLHFSEASLTLNYFKFLSAREMLVMYSDPRTPLWMNMQR